MKESDIVHERGDFWVFKDKKGYHVMKAGITHSTSDSSYTLDENGLSVAKARCNYLDNRARKA